ERQRPEAIPPVADAPGSPKFGPRALSDCPGSPNGAAVNSQGRQPLERASRHEWSPERATVTAWPIRTVALSGLADAWHASLRGADALGYCLPPRWGFRDRL